MKMRFVPWPGARGEGRIAAGMMAVGLVGAAWLWLGLPTPGCLFHTLTGLPCLTCGGTRCMRGLLAGDFAAALSWNPLVFLATALSAAFVLYAGIVAVFRLPRLRCQDVTPGDRRLLRTGLVAVALANWAYLLVRFSGHA